MEQEGKIDSVEALARKSRRIETFISDYSPDDKQLAYQDRVSYYRLLKEQLGVQAIRTEFRMKNLLDKSGNFNQSTVDTYVSSLRAMKEAGLEAPSIVLFTPAKWMKKLARENEEQFLQMYRNYVGKIVEICKTAEVVPRRIQVMNEVNTKFQTTLKKELLLKMLKATGETFRPNFPEVKINTTVLTAPKKGWQAYVKDLVSKAGADLDSIGFDYYPGSYDKPAGVPIVGKKPYLAFAQDKPYEWIAQEKLYGCLKGKETLLAETGVPALSKDSKMQRFGYDRIIQTLDHFLLNYEKQGVKAEEIFGGVGFFAAGNFRAVETKVPGRIDFVPWTLVRKNKAGEWQLTNAGKNLKNLIQTRLNPTG